MSNDITETIEIVNEFVKGKIFFEFYVYSFTKDGLVLVGSTDISYYHNVELRFRNVGFMCCGTGWHVDTDKAIMGIISGQEAVKINEKYGILQGQTLIRLNNEDNIMQWVACELLEVDIKNVHYNRLNVDEENA